MAEEVGIVMSLYDRVSPTLKAIAGNSKAFDKSLDELEASLKAYDKAQESLVKRSANLKKSLAEADQEVKNAQKSYKKLNDEVSKKALDEAIDRQAELRRELTETESSLRANAKAYDTLYENARKAANGVQTVTVASSKAENRAGSGSTGILSALGQAGAWSMLGDVASQWAGTLVTSLGGGDVGTMFSSALASAGSGAAIGTMINPGLGTAIGTALGGLVGLASGGAQIYEQQDDAFKAYYQQLYEQGQQSAEESLTSGSATAAQRELDLIAFDQLLGGKGAKYLADLREMAADTPMEYEDLTAMSQALATGFGKDQQRMLDLMEGIGNAGSAVGVDASGMTYMAQVMSRMQSSGTVSREDLNAFQDRGINVIEMLSKSLGKSQGDIYDMISKGAISGTQAVDIIQKGLGQFDGAMDKMAQTFNGLTSTLEDTMTDINAAGGEAYNETRENGIQDQIEAYGGELGNALANLNRASGQNKAYMDNLSDQYMREALEAVLLGRETTLYSPEQQEKLADMAAEYNKAKLESDRYGSQQARLDMENLYQEAQALATAAYESSDAYLMVHDAETELIAAIRENTAAQGGWRNEYEISQELSKGQAAVSHIYDTGDDSPAARVQANNSYRYRGIGTSYAYGLDRVPYDNFPALLHEGERVLTAQEAREADHADSRSISIMVTGNNFGAGVSAEEIAQRLADAIELKFAAGVLS